MNSNEISSEFSDNSLNQSSSGVSSASSTNSLFLQDIIDNINSYSINIEINDSGRKKFAFSFCFNF